MKELMQPAAATPLDHLATRAGRLPEGASGDEVLLRSSQLPGGALPPALLHPLHLPS